MLMSSFLPSIVTIRKRHRLSAVKLGSGDGDVTQYVTEPRKHWDSFYERHQNKFFKDRHYLEKDWGHYFCDENDTLPSNGKIILEAGCGTGNTIFPLAKKFPQIFVHACDFSHQAVTLVKAMLMNKNRIISENFYFRGDGTCSFYFSEDLLSELFVSAGFTVVDVNTYNREIENRAKNITMQRRWIRAVFRCP